jgi:hypothetical protein
MKDNIDFLGKLLGGYDHREEHKPITWDQLVELEPRLLQLLTACQNADNGRGSEFDGDAVWYGVGGFKSRLVGLVGFFAKRDDARLHTCQAYDCAYKHLYESLPPDREEGEEE